MSDPNEWNRQVIAEFRANGGKVSGYFEGANMILLHTAGAKTGQPRINPLVYATDGDRLVIIASKGGADTNPDWYYNLLANPVATVEVGTEQFQVRATAVTEEPERSRLYGLMVAHREGFAEYEQKNQPQDPGRPFGTSRIASTTCQPRLQLFGCVGRSVIQHQPYLAHPTPHCLGHQYAVDKKPESPTKRLRARQQPATH